MMPAATGGLPSFAKTYPDQGFIIEVMILRNRPRKHAKWKPPVGIPEAF